MGFHYFSMTQDDLFGEQPVIAPHGLRYQPQLLSEEDAVALVTLIAPLPFKEFEFHGFTGKRLVVSFGWKYDFSSQRLERIGYIPDFLIPLRDGAAHFADLDPEALEQVLVTEYQSRARPLAGTRTRPFSMRSWECRSEHPARCGSGARSTVIGSGGTSGSIPAPHISLRARPELNGSIPSRPWPN